MFGYVPCLPNSSKTFTIKGCWILSKAYLPIMRWSWVFSFTLVIRWIIVIDFHMLNIPVSLWWSLLDHSGWYFWCVLEFFLQVSYWVVLNHCSWGKLVCNAFFVDLCGVGASGWLWPCKINWTMVFLFLFLWNNLRTIWKSGKIVC